MRNANRPQLTARSLIASLLLGLDPPRTTAQFLVRSNELFGVSEGTTRTALSRMVAAGELAAQGGDYELQGDLRARQARQSESRRAERLGWDGTWVLFIIDRDRRTPTERAAFREAARRLRLIEWREGLWCRPDNLDPERLPDSRSVVTAQSTAVFGARPDDPPVDRFATEAWAAEAEHLAREMAELEPALASGAPDALQRGFVLSADTIRHFGADPLLPDELLSETWPGDALRKSFDHHEMTFTRTHRLWFDSARRSPPD